MNLVERLVTGHVAAGGGDRVAYVDPDVGEVSYQRLHAAMARYRALLRRSGVRPGSPGLVVADDSVATVVAVLGLWAHHCVPVVVSPMLTEAELRFILEDCSAHFVQLDAAPERQDVLRPVFAARPGATGDQIRELILADTNEDSTVKPYPADRAALIQYTSGSTGGPKGVLHAVAGIEAVMRGFGSLLALTPSDTVLSTAKLSFGYGFGNSLLFPLAAGARTALLPGPVDGHIVSAALRRHDPTVLFGVPRVFRSLVDLSAAGRLPSRTSLRLAVSAGEHLPAELYTNVRKALGVPIVNGLGATEVLHIVVATHPDREEPGSTGHPVPGVTVTVRDSDGNPVPDGVDGRLHIAGPTVALGYLDRPEASARTFANGGAYTGDIVRRGPAGDVQYLCRADDMLNLGGFRVAPAEIERALRDAAGVADCAVVGRTDAAGLQQAVAYVVPAPGAGHPEVRRSVRAALRAGLAPFKHPSRIELINALPTTSTGKLARFKLRDRASAATAAVRRVVLRDGERSLVCLPFAGGTAHAFARLARWLDRSWRIVTGEPAYGPGWTPGIAAEAWWPVVEPELRPGSVLFGHSLGAATLAELAARYHDRLDGVHVVLSSPPLRPAEPVRAALAGDDTAACASLADAGMLPGTRLTVDEIRRLVLPRYRRDVELLRGGWTPPDPAVPVHVLIGTEDQYCRAEDLASVAGWPVAGLRLVEGGHYFCVTNAAATARALEEIAAG